MGGLARAEEEMTVNFRVSRITDYPDYLWGLIRILLRFLKDYPGLPPNFPGLRRNTLNFLGLPPPDYQMAVSRITLVVSPSARAHPQTLEM